MEDSKNFNVVRFKRIKHSGQITNATSHNFRVHKNIKNVDYTKTDENVYLIGDNKTNLHEEFNALKQKFGFKYIKDKFNMYDEFVFTASPDFFEGKTKEEIVRYFKDNINILQKNFFKVPGSLVSAVVHFDEKTPHCHVLACPLVCDTKKEIKRGKDKGKIIEGEFYSLSHDRILGKRQQCRDLQNVFNNELNSLGWNVKRGSKNTAMKHTTKAEFNKSLKEFKQATKRSFAMPDFFDEFKKMNQMQKILNANKLMDEVEKIVKIVESYYTKFKAAKTENNRLNEQNERLRSRLDHQSAERKSIEQKEREKFLKKLEEFKNFAKQKIVDLQNHVNKLELKLSSKDQEIKQLKSNVEELEELNRISNENEVNKIIESDPVLYQNFLKSAEVFYDKMNKNENSTTQQHNKHKKTFKNWGKKL